MCTQHSLLECQNQEKDKDEPYKWFQDSLDPGTWDREKSNKERQSESEKQIEYKCAVPAWEAWLEPKDLPRTK